MKGCCFIALVTILYGCSGDGNDIVAKISFENSKMIETTLVTSEFTGCLNDIRSAGNKIVVLDLQCSENLFYVFDYPDFKLLGKFGKTGRGPSDFDFPQIIDLEKKENGEYFLWVNNVNRKQIQAINLDSALSGNENPQTKIVLKPSALPAFQIAFLDESKNKFIGRTDHMSQGIFFIYDNQKAEKMWVENYPNLFESASENEKGTIFHSTLCINTDSSRVLTALRMFPRLNLFNIQGVLLKSLIINKEANSSVSVTDGKKLLTHQSEYFCIDAISSKDKIYVNYLVQTTYQDITDHPEKIKSYVLVFDWSLHLLNTFKLDRYVEKFVQVKENEFVGYSVDKDGLKPLVKFALPL